MTERTDNVCYRPSRALLVVLFCVLAGVLFLTAIPTVWAIPSQGPCPPGTIPVAQVTIHGPTRGVLNVTYVFLATVTPITYTRPITYVWAPEPASGQSTANASYMWTTPGRKAIIVIALNPEPYHCGAVSDWHEILIPSSIHLPVIRRG
jgi:hypothetical protein